MKIRYLKSLSLASATLIALPFLSSYQFTLREVPKAPAYYLPNLHSHFEGMPLDIDYYLIDSMFDDNTDIFFDDYNFFSTLSTLKQRNPSAANRINYYGDNGGYSNDIAMVVERTARGAQLINLFNIGDQGNQALALVGRANSKYLTVRHQESKEYPPYTRFWAQVGQGRLKDYYQQIGACSNCTRQQLFDALKADLQFKIDAAEFSRLSPEEMIPSIVDGSTSRSF